MIVKEIMSDNISVKDLPNIWNEKYEKYLGVKIENDSEGVMQDTHWASGYIGYFPTYALGNIYSEQLLTKLENYLPKWKDEIKHGKIHNIKQWLKKNIYQYGNLYDPSELIKKVTGEKINVKPYLKYLDNKYSELYEY